MEDKDLSFEQALEGLESSAEALKSEDTTLEEALLRFEEGMKYYEKCKEHLAAANKKYRSMTKLRRN